MKFKTCKTSCIEVPVEFPDANYGAFVTQNMRLAQTDPVNVNGILQKEFGHAINVIPWRFRAAFEYRDEYINLWEKKGVHGDHNYRYKREKAIYGWLSNKISAIEVTAYSLYVVSTFTSKFGIDFSEGTRRSMTFDRFIDKVPQSDPEYKLKRTLKSIKEAPNFILLKSIRNRLTHRGNIPQEIKVDLGYGPRNEILNYGETWSTEILRGDTQRIDTMFKWFSESIENMIQCGLNVTEKIQPKGNTSATAV